MRATSLGTDIDDFRLPPKEGLRRATELDLRFIELGAVGDLSPRQLSSSGRRHLLHLVESLGLKLTALGADLPSLRFTDSRTADERVERTCEILELARLLGVPVVTAAVGALAHPETGTPSSTAMDAFRRIGEFADSRGVIFAFRPSHDSPERVTGLLRELACPAIHVSLDPAALVMSGNNPVALVERLADQIHQVQARDATVGLPERGGRETRLGEGDVDWRGLIAALKDCDYHQPFILRRLDSQTPIKDIAGARDELRRLLARPA
jgi:sugar phosphate isomerase/epimerase